MHWIDWGIVGGLFIFVILMAWLTKKYTKSVADFLAADRCAGRYLVCISEGLAGLGAVSIVAAFEMHYVSGFTSSMWWSLMGRPISLIVIISGWVIYRYRQTRAMTLAQFLELRYSRKFRIFAGLLAFFSGIINFGLYPAVGARFFVYFCGFPETVSILGFVFPTFALIMLVLISVALFLTNLGGQITVIVTDFFQCLFCNIVFLLINVVLLLTIDWSMLIESLKTAPAEQSLLHPFHTSGGDFNMWFFLIGALGAFYNKMAWQGTQAYNCSAKNAHEARMAGILGFWLWTALALVLMLLPLTAYMYMHHPAYSSIANSVNVTIDAIKNETIQTQMIVPVALGHILPIGLIGAFCAVMFATFISTHESCLHSWGSIFIQDCIMPLYKKPLATKQHLWLLRLSNLLVAVFAFFFALFYRQTQYIYMFFAITGAIFLGGAGAVIIGGLYWSRGTTAAAWWSMIIGSTLSVMSLVISQLPDFVVTESNFVLSICGNIYHTLKHTNGQILYFYAMMISVGTYIFVSLIGKKKIFNVDKMLHRGKYAIKEDNSAVTASPAVGFKALGITNEFTMFDKFIYFASIAWVLGWWTVFIIGTIYNLTCHVSTDSWAKFWYVNIWIYFILGFITVIWFTIGGLRDFMDMIRTLRTAKRNFLDDGRVIDHHNVGENTVRNAGEVA